MLALLLAIAVTTQAPNYNYAQPRQVDEFGRMMQAADNNEGALLIFHVGQPNARVEELKAYAQRVGHFFLAIRVGTRRGSHTYDRPGTWYYVSDGKSWVPHAEYPLRNPLFAGTDAGHTVGNPPPGEGPHPSNEEIIRRYQLLHETKEVPSRQYLEAARMNMQNVWRHNQINRQRFGPDYPYAVPSTRLAP